jgi:hypothetical protein
MQLFTFVVAALLLVLQVSTVHGEKFPVVDLSPPGTRFQDLPGYAALHPKTVTGNLEIKLTPATLRVSSF